MGLQDEIDLCLELIRQRIHFRLCGQHSKAS
jgi:hypothetical protein